LPILEEILATLADESPVRDVVIGPRSSLVEGASVGVAYRHRDGADAPLPPPPPWREASVERLARLALSLDPVEASVGVAAVNAAIQPAPDELEEGNGYQLVLEKGAGRDVTLVGHFSFVERLREKARTLYVLELNPGEGDIEAARAPEVIPRSDVVAITGSTLVNHTLEDLLALARGRHVILLGPSTIFSTVLFDHGVSSICGAVVRDVAEVKRVVGEGVDFRSSTGIRKVIWRRRAPRSRR
jgi:uncharacterized protein